MKTQNNNRSDTSGGGSNELRKIPNVGKRTEKVLREMGYDSIESLKGKRAVDLYAEECSLKGSPVDRCQLYLYRAVEYFVNTENPDPAKCNGGFGRTNRSKWHLAVLFVRNAGASRQHAKGAGRFGEKYSGWNTRMKPVVRYMTAA